MSVTLDYKVFDEQLKKLSANTTCHYNLSNDKCDYKCKVFKNGMCSNWHSIIYNTHEDKLIENLIEAKGEFYVLTLKALINYTSIIDILIKHYEYK